MNVSNPNGRRSRTGNGPLTDEIPMSLKNTLRLTLLLAALTLMFAGCTGEEETTDTASSVDSISDQTSTADVVADVPITPWWGTADDLTQAAAIWDEINGEDFSNTWALMPGTKRNMTSDAPHGGNANVYINSIAAGEPTNLAPGSIIVKASMPAAGAPVSSYSLIKKIPGFDPDHQNWFWAEYNSTGGVVSDEDGVPLAGAIGPNKTSDCLKCHSFDEDFVFLN